MRVSLSGGLLASWLTSGHNVKLKLTLRSGRAASGVRTLRLGPIDLLSSSLRHSGHLVTTHSTPPLVTFRFSRGFGDQHNSSRQMPFLTRSLLASFGLALVAQQALGFLPPLPQGESGTSEIRKNEPSPQHSHEPLVWE